MRRRITLFSLLIAALIASHSGWAVAETADPSVPDSGLARRGGVLVSSGERSPVPQPCLAGYMPVVFLADAYPDHFGSPTVSPATCEVVLPASEQGAAMYAQASAGRLGAPVAKEVAASGKSVVLPRVETKGVVLTPLVSSLRQVRATAQEVNLALRSGMPQSAIVVETREDPVTGLPIITVNNGADEVLSLVASRAGERDIIVEVRQDRVQATLASRDLDWGPHVSGSKIYPPRGGTCTVGFLWDTGAPNASVTAGHCASEGGEGAWPYPYAHKIVYYSGSRENWVRGTGTVYLTGQSEHLGDLAMGYQSTGPYSPATMNMYVGSATSTTRIPVGGWWTRPSYRDDQFCTGGAATGELCGWKVTNVGYIAEVSHGSEGIARRMMRGERPRSSGCADLGDSGGSVYTVDSAGKAWAKGYVSSVAMNSTTCYVYFTDQYLADQGFPGHVIVG